MAIFNLENGNLSFFLEADDKSVTPTIYKILTVYVSAQTEESGEPLEIKVDLPNANPLKEPYRALILGKDKLTNVKGLCFLSVFGGPEYHTDGTILCSAGGSGASNWITGSLVSDANTCETIAEDGSIDTPDFASVKAKLENGTDANDMNCTVTGFMLSGYSDVDSSCMVDNSCW